MKYLRNIHLILLVLFFSQAIATDLYWTGQHNDDWHNSLNWNPGQVPTLYDDVFFDQDLAITFNVDLGITAAQCKAFVVSGETFSILLPENGILEIDDELTLSSASLFSNHGTVEIINNLWCYGNFENRNNALLDVGQKIKIFNSGILENFGNGVASPAVYSYNMDNFGEFTSQNSAGFTVVNRYNNYADLNILSGSLAEVGDYLFNTGIITVNNAALRVISTFENVGYTHLEAFSKLDGDDNLLLLNYADFFVYTNGEATGLSELRNYELIENYGYIEVHDLWMYFKGDLWNYDHMHVVYTAENDGEILNEGYFYIGDEFDIDPTGSVINTGCFEVQGFISNEGVYEGSLLFWTSIFGPGTYRYHRDIGGTGNPEESAGWHYISSPVWGYSSHNMFDYWLISWDESQNHWFELSPGGVPCEQGIPNDLEAMRGYSVKRNLNYECGSVNPGTGNIIEFEASMNAVGSEQMEIEVTGSEHEPGDPNAMNNWNLIGNPYPSAIDAGAIVFPPEIDNAIYYYDDASLGYVAYVGGVGPAAIPVAQGFFVHVNTPGTHMFTLYNYMKTCAGSDDWYKNEISHLLEISVSDGTKSDKTYIRFKEEATHSFDKALDAYKLLSGIESVPQVYTSGDGVKYAINTVQETDRMDLNFKHGSSEAYTLTVDGVEDFDEVILEDEQNDQFIDLKNSNTFTFYHSEQDKKDRFVIHFTEPPFGYTPEGFQVYGEGNNIKVNNIHDRQGVVCVYNLVGQCVQKQALGDGLNTVTMPPVHGLYIVEVMTSTDRSSFKVYLK